MSGMMSDADRRTEEGTKFSTSGDRVVSPGDRFEYAGDGDVDYEEMVVVGVDEKNDKVTLAFGGDPNDTSTATLSRFDDYFPNWARA